MKKIKEKPQEIKLLPIIILCILLAVIPVVIIHILFKWNSGKQWLIAEWSSGEILNYLGTILSFIGTVILGACSFKISKQTKIISEKLFEKEMQESIPFVNIMPKITIKSKKLESCMTKFENIQTISSTNAMYIEKISLSKEQAKQHHFIEYLIKFSFKNTSNVQIKKAIISTDSLRVMKAENDNLIISEFLNNCSRENIKLFLNFESIDEFSCYIKIYALDKNIAQYILESDTFCISFEIEYESVAGITKKLFHQLWIEKNDNQYVITAVRTSDLENEEK